MMVQIQQDTFEANIDLEKLHLLGAGKCRKLFQFASTEVIDEMSGFFQSSIPVAKDAWKSASAVYRQNYKWVENPKARDTETKNRLRTNRKLKADVKRTKAVYDSAVKLLSILEIGRK